MSGVLWSVLGTLGAMLWLYVSYLGIMNSNAYVTFFGLGVAATQVYLIKSYILEEI